MSKKAVVVVPAGTEEIGAALAARDGFTAQLKAIRDGGAAHLSETVPQAMALYRDRDSLSASADELAGRLKDARAARDAHTHYRHSIIRAAIAVDPNVKQSDLGQWMFASGYTGAVKTMLSREFALATVEEAAKAGGVKASAEELKRSIRNANVKQREAVVKSLRAGTLPEAPPEVEGSKQVRENLPAVKAERILKDAEALSNLIARCESMTAEQQARMREILSAIGRKIPAAVVESSAGKATA